MGRSQPILILHCVGGTTEILNSSYRSRGLKPYCSSVLWAIKELSRFIMCSQFHNFQFGKRRTLSLSNDKWHFSLCNIPLARVPMTSSSDLLQQLCFLRKLRGAFSDYIRKMYRCIISQFLLLLYKLLKSCIVKLLICTSKLSPLKRYNTLLKKEFT